MQKSLMSRLPVVIPQLPLEMEVDGHQHDTAHHFSQPHQAPSYTEGNSCLITVNDGFKDCLALLVTEEMVAALNNLRRENQSVAAKAQLLDAARGEALDIEIDLEGLKAHMEYAKDAEKTQDEEEETRVRVEQLQSKLREAEIRRDLLKEDFDPMNIDLQDTRESILNIFSQVFDEAFILDPLAPQHDYSQSTMDEIGDQYQQRVLEEEPKSCPLSPEEFLRQAACDELQRSYFALMRAQAEFDDRDQDYDRKLDEFKQLEEEGGFECTRTDFDCRQLQHKRELTRVLTRAGEVYENAKVQANKHAVPSSERPESDYSTFADRDDDGYRESAEACAVADVDRGRIESWMSCVPAIQDELFREDVQPYATDVNEWDARLPIDMWESISTFDTIGYAAKISRWQSHCRNVRQGTALSPAEDWWASHDLERQ